MSDPRPRLRQPVALAILVAFCAACGGAPQGGSAAPEEAAVREVQTYEVRGVVSELPHPDDPASEIYLRHEAIDDFADIDGDVVGMDSMTMPFPLAPGVSLADLAAGDRVSFTLEIEWQGDPPYRIARIERLPDEAELEFRAARPGRAGDPPNRPD